MSGWGNAAKVAYKCLSWLVQLKASLESAPDMTLVLKTLVPTLLVAVVLQLDANIVPRKVSLKMALEYINKITGNLTVQVRAAHLSPPRDPSSRESWTGDFFRTFMWKMWRMWTLPTVGWEVGFWLVPWTSDHLRQQQPLCLTDDVCFFHVQDAFFCKVQDILQYNNFTKFVEDGQYITENLKMYLHPEEVRIFRPPSARYLSIGAAIVSIFFFFCRWTAAWFWRTWDPRTSANLCLFFWKTSPPVFGTITSKGRYNGNYFHSDGKSVIIIFDFVAFNI